MSLSTFALTGGIGSGKSLVGRHFVARNVPVVDADALARQAVVAGSSALAEIVERFGSDVVAPDGSLDRAALGRVVFDDAAARRDLEAIVHPRVRDLLHAKLRELDQQGRAAACYEVPLLYEAGLDAQFSPVVVVVASEPVRIARVMARDGCTENDVRKRMASQWPLQRKASRADYVIDNDGPVERTLAQADETLRRVYERLGAPWPPETPSD